MSRLLVLPSAPVCRAGHPEAADWYEGEEDELGGQFVDELRHIVRRISDLPSQFPDVGWGGVRRDVAEPMLRAGRAMLQG
ncbi:hypothetical protein BE17_10235 [Sorangium cellulosum]|uniref:Uncharacterized protein n=1 Tax=Sorangium cellulosum TaxID=56 RepID=A0A150R7U2_SORCE|nr:hypothetical protein BE17_10235 [Sorangium cellulosum]